MRQGYRDFHTEKHYDNEWVHLLVASVEIEVKLDYGVKTVINIMLTSNLIYRLSARFENIKLFSTQANPISTQSQH